MAGDRHTARYLHGIGQRQHFLPAGFLGGFSSERTEPARKRVLWVARRDGRVFPERAENVAWRRDLYTLTTFEFGAGDPLAVDRHLSAPEPRLRAAVNALESVRDGWLRAEDWRVLVCFITSLFVRAPEFALRFERRLGPEITSLLSPDNTTMGRVIEQQRLFAPIMYANWIVARAPGGRVPTNDLGYLMTKDLGSGRWGYGIPLSTDLIVALFPGPAVHTLRWSSGRWLIDMPFVEFSPSDVAEMSYHVASGAVAELYGPSEAVVRAARTGFDEEPARSHGFGPGLLVPSTAALRDHEYAYMHLIGLLAEPPRDGNSELLMGWPQHTRWESRDVV